MSEIILYGVNQRNRLSEKSIVTLSRPCSGTVSSNMLWTRASQAAAPVSREFSMRPCRVSVPVILFVAALSFAPAGSASAQPPAPFAAFVDDYYAAYFDWDPNQATYAGIHD